MQRRDVLAGIVGALGLAAADAGAKKRQPKAEDHDTTWKWKRHAPRVINYLPNELAGYAQHATADWRAATGGRLCLKHAWRQAVTCEDGVLPEQGEIAICWSNQRVGLSGGTQLYFAADGITIVAALVKIYGPTDDPYLGWTIPHELGHAIGLKHSAYPPEESVMADVYHSPARAPGSHDREVVSAKYAKMAKC